MGKTNNLAVLRKNRMLASTDEARRFDAALAKLSEDPQSVDLPSLFRVFTDQCELHEVMWGLLHFVESFGMEKQLPGLIKALPSMLKEAPEWAELFHFRILNDDRYTDYYKTLVAALSDAEKAPVVEVLNRVRQKNAKFKSAASYVLSGSKKAPRHPGS